MQRFKKEMIIRNAYVPGCTNPFIFAKGPLRMDRDGKFVYGANGTLTQAAQWRKQAVERIGELRETEHFRHRGLRISCIRSLLDSSRRGGCCLPA